MRLLTLVVTAILATTSAAAQDAQSSSPPADSSAPADAKTRADLPVSLDRIREGLDRPTSGANGMTLKALDKQPDFRVEIREKRKLEELIASLDFKSGPTPAGGLYAFEQQRLLTPPVDNPLAQPYAAFNQGQLMTILVENLVGKYLAGKAINAVTKAQRESAEESARREVEDAITEYCSAKPNHGAGIQLCAPATPAGSSAPATR
jgi:hypothetical protein